MDAIQADLALLDDPYKHAHCTVCQEVKRGSPFLARCGRRAVGLHGVEVFDTADLPESMTPCPECLALWDEPCPWCGVEPW